METDYLKAQVREHQIDAIVVSRLVKAEKNVTYFPGHAYTVPYPYYRSFYGYYPVAYAQVYSPDYLRGGTQGARRDQPVRDRDAGGRIVWTGISDTFNPNSPKKAIDGVVKFVVKELEKEGIF